MGHYNKRCKQEIPTNYHLAEFSQTGFGQKFRAHPLAIAMANQQFSHLDEWISQKAMYAQWLIKDLSDCSFLRMPECKNGQPSWYAFVMSFDEQAVNGVTVDKFVNALHAEGLVEVDLPRSTCPIHDLPLFRSPERAMPRLYNCQLQGKKEFPNAGRFYQMAIKIPVWAFPEDEDVVRAYIKGFKKVIDVVNREPKLLR